MGAGPATGAAPLRPSPRGRAPTYRAEGPLGLPGWSAHAPAPGPAPGPAPLRPSRPREGRFEPPARTPEAEAAARKGPRLPVTPAPDFLPAQEALPCAGLAARTPHPAPPAAAEPPPGPASLRAEFAGFLSLVLILHFVKILLQGAPARPRQWSL